MVVRSEKKKWLEVPCRVYNKQVSSAHRAGAGSLKQVKVHNRQGGA